MCYHGDVDQYVDGNLEFCPFWWEKASKRLVTLAVSAPAHQKMAQMKGEVALKSTDILIMLLHCVTMEILINMVTAILNFVRFGSKRLVKGLVTLAVSVPAHHKMAQMKGEVVLKSIDVLIMLLHHVTMEILINMVAAILKEDTPLFITFDIAHKHKPINLLPITAWKYDKVGMSVKSRLRAH